MLTRQYFIDSAAQIDERESKLPVWAQEKLNTLRKATTEACTELAQLRGATEPAPFWLDNWDKKGDRFYLPKNAGRLHFASSTGELSLLASGGQDPDGLLQIIGDNGVVVAPSSSNVVLIRAGRA